MNHDLDQSNFDDSQATVRFLIDESSNRMRTYFGLAPSELIPGKMPRIVTRKDLSLDNYFAELLLRTCYAPSDELSSFEEIIIRGNNADLSSALNPQIVGAVLIGIGGQSRSREFLRAYDEHRGPDGTRTMDSASQVVFSEHLNRYRRSHGNIHSILGILRPLNAADSKGEAGENHLIQMTKKLHLAQFQSPGYVVEGFSPQLKRAIIDACLSALCLEINNLRGLDMPRAGQELRDAWKLYRERREVAVRHDRLMPVSIDTFGKVVNRTSSNNPDQISDDPNLRGKKKIQGRLRDVLIGLGSEQRHPFSMRRIYYALRKVWGDDLALFVIGFLMEALLQLQEEFERGLKSPLDETPVPGTDLYIYFHLMSVSDMQPHRAIIYQVNGQQKKGLVVIRDSRRQITTIFKTKSLPEGDWSRFLDWLNEEEPGRWYRPFNEETQSPAVFVLNGTRYYLGSEPSELKKEDLINVLSGLAKRR